MISQGAVRMGNLGSNVFDRLTINFTERFPPGTTDRTPRIGQGIEGFSFRERRSQERSVVVEEKFSLYNPATAEMADAHLDRALEMGSVRIVEAYECRILVTAIAVLHLRVALKNRWHLTSEEVA